MIPFGPWHPDKSGINVQALLVAKNCIPAVNGYRPMPSLQPSSDALNDDCLGATVLFDEDGDVFIFAADAAKLYKLSAQSTWGDVTRLSGGDYSAGAGERWQFGAFGGLVIAVNHGDDPQKFLLNTSSNFEPLGGLPPRSRYITTVRDFIVLGGLFNDERSIHWSGLANPEHWTIGTQNSGKQTFQNGGPIRGLVGGETGYVWQTDRITRMVFVPGSDIIFQFDEVEGGRGLAAPHSLVKVGNTVYYLAADGFYSFGLGSGASTPIGVGKWSKFFIDDIKSGQEINSLGGVDPSGRFIIWSYNSRDNASVALNRSIIYDWALDEATIVETSVLALAQLLTPGFNLDNMDGQGSLDSIEFSLDSPVWRGGIPLLAIFGSDKKMSFLSGPAMAAEYETNDGETPRRHLIKSVRPHIDTRDLTISVSSREASGDPISYNAEEPMSDTGAVPAWSSGFLSRAKLKINAGASWSKITGVDVNVGGIGQR